MTPKQRYPTRHYEVSKFLFTLRSRTRLTQAILAEKIGVHRRSVQKWESGETYPTPDNLHTLIELFIELGGFIPEQEYDEAAALWQLVSQHAPQKFPPFNAPRFAQLLAARTVRGQNAQQPVVNASGQNDNNSFSTAPPPVISTQLPLINFPFQTTRLIGREAEIAQIGRLLTDPACRLLTLLGPGGMGKTRLALAAAQEYATTVNDAVAFVPLISVKTPSQIVTAIGEALNLSFAGQPDATTHLLAHLRLRPMLLLLDDFEHLLEGADLVTRMLQVASHLTILATSRTRLNLQMEWLFDVEGLSCPPGNDPEAATWQRQPQWTEYSAVQLFLQRATQIQPGFSQSQPNLAAIGRICQHVAGMPLAIELAAASIRTLPLIEIERQIRANLDVLSTSLRDVPPRHRSLRAVFDHSWHLLNASERILLSRLAVFRGGWDQSSVEFICARLAKTRARTRYAENELPPSSYTFSLVELAALIDKSLVGRIYMEPPTSGEHDALTATAEPRFFLLEPIREYALEQLMARGEAEILQHAHATYYLMVAETAAAQWVSSMADAAIERLEHERDNLYAALQWALDGGHATMGLRLGGPLIKFWRRRGLLAEGRFWLENLLALDDDALDLGAQNARLIAMQGAAWLASDQHDYERSTQLFEQSIVLRRTLGESEDETNLLVNGALQARTEGHYAQATALLEDALAQQRALGNRGSLGGFGLGLTLFLLGLVLREQGEFVRAAALFNECVQLHRALGDREGVATGLLALSDIARDRGNVTELHNYAGESLPVLQELGVQWGMGFALNNLALAAYLTGDLVHAFAQIRESVAIFRAQKAEGSLAEVLITLGQIAGTQDLAAAHAALTEALRLAWDVGPRLMVAAALEALANLTMQTGRDHQHATVATRFLAAAATLRTQMGAPIRPVEQSGIARTQATIRSILDADTLATVWAEAVATPLAQLLSSISGVESWAATPAIDAAVSTVASVRQEVTRADWGLARDVPVLYGRADELATLTHWVLTDQCRVITLVGMGGIGKTSLAVTFAKQIASHFNAVIFRSLGEAPPIPELLDQLIHGVSTDRKVIPLQLSDKLVLLIELLSQTRALLILDNLETLLQTESADISYLAGYEGYETLFEALAETTHQSCLILTSREHPHELSALEGAHTPARSLRLRGLSEEACRAILADQDLTGSAKDAAALAQRYGGNPLALKLVAGPIRALFGGDLALFLPEGNLFFNGVGQLLTQQISRASVLEQELLTWLALVREPVTLQQLIDLLTSSPSKAGPMGSSRSAILAALHTLWGRNLLELGHLQLTFTLQRVVLEYFTEHLVEQTASEIVGRNFDFLHRFALIQATAKEYVRRSQEQLILMPLAERLVNATGDALAAERQLLSILAAWRNTLEIEPLLGKSYGAGNVINLLRLLRGNLCGLDLTHLSIRQAYLQGVEAQDATLAGSLLTDSVFTETFDDILDVAVSSSGTLWAAASKRGEIRIWADDGLTLRWAWRAHTNMIWTLAFSPDECMVASGSWDGTVKVWNVATGACRWSGQHTSHVNSVAFSPDSHLLATGGNDATVRLWDAEHGIELQALPHSDPVSGSGVTWNADGSLLAAGDLAGNIWIWEIHRSGRVVNRATCVRIIVAHTELVDGLAFSPDGTMLASAGWDGAVKIWEVATGSMKQQLIGYENRPGRVAWSPDGHTLAVSGLDPTIWLWDVKQASYQAVLQGHTDGVCGLAFTPNSRTLLSCGNGAVRAWDVASRQCMRVIQGHTDFLYVLDWSPDGTQLVSGGMDGLVIIWDITGKSRPRLLPGHCGAVCGVGWNRDGRWLASAEWENNIRLWDSASGECIQILQHPDDAGNFFYGLEWSPDGRQLAIGTSRRGVQIFEEAAEQSHWHGHGWVGRECLTWIRHITWSPDGAKVAGGGDDGVIYIWDAAQGALLQMLAGHQGMVMGVVWSPDGAQLASSSRGIERGELFVWDLQSAERVMSFAGHNEIVSAVAWGPNKDILVSGDGGKLRWWDVQSGTCIRVIEAHQGAVQALRCNPAAMQLASCGDDGAIKIWDLHNGVLLQTLRRDRPYEHLNITGIRGVTEAQKEMLYALGAIEHEPASA